MAAHIGFAEAWLDGCFEKGSHGPVLIAGGSTNPAEQYLLSRVSGMVPDPSFLWAARSSAATGSEPFDDQGDTLSDLTENSWTRF
jgi:hypothetical protein